MARRHSEDGGQPSGHCSDQWRCGADDESNHLVHPGERVGSLNFDHRLAVIGLGHSGRRRACSGRAARDLVLPKETGGQLTPSNALTRLAHDGRTASTGARQSCLNLQHTAGSLAIGNSANAKVIQTGRSDRFHELLVSLALAERISPGQTA